MEHEACKNQYPIANIQLKGRSTSNFYFLVGYSLLYLDISACTGTNKKKTDPNPPVWTGLNEKIDI